MFFSSRRGSWRIWLVIGLGLCLYGLYEWDTLHIPSESELSAIIESQYQSEIARVQERAGETPVQLTPEWQEKFRTAIRNEQLAPVEKARKRFQSLVGVGLVLIVLAAGMFVFERQTDKLNPKP